MGKLADDLLREDIIRVAQGIAALMDELKELAEDGHYQSFGVDWQKRLESAADRILTHKHYAQ